MEIKVGRIYRAKKPLKLRGFIGDRHVVFMNDKYVKYRSPTTRGVWMSIAKFQEWAHIDVTHHLANQPLDWETA